MARTLLLPSALVVSAGVIACACPPGAPATTATTATPTVAEDAADWPGYNRTLTSERFSPLTALDRTNVAGLRPICTYDLALDTRFQTGPIVIGQTLHGMRACRSRRTP